MTDEDSICDKVGEFIIHWLPAILSVWTSAPEREV
jgi:hypothetical protein